MKAKAETLYNFEYSLLSIYFSLQWTFLRFNISKIYKSFYVIHPAVKNYSEWVDFRYVGLQHRYVPSIYMSVLCVNGYKYNQNIETEQKNK